MSVDLQLRAFAEGRAGTIAGKRVLIVLGSFELGGAERQAALLADLLTGHEIAQVAVLGLADPDGRALHLFRRRGIRCEHHGLRWRGGMCYRWLQALQLMRFLRVVRRIRPDILLPFYGLPNILCGLTWRMTGARTCIWNQRDDGFPIDRRLERAAVRCTPCFVSNSTAGMEHLLKCYHIRPNKVHLVRNGVALEPASHSRQEWRWRLRLAPKQPTACMIGNLHGNKDHDTLIRAWRLVVDRLSSAQAPPVLLLAGYWGNNAASLRALANELGLFDEVRFLGPIDDVSGLLSACDLSVFSSLREGCPNGILEPMAAGLPVVATDISGSRDALGMDAGLQLTPPRDSDRIAHAVFTFLQDDELRQTVGVRNRERIASEFSLDRLLTEMVRLIDEQLVLRRS